MVSGRARSMHDARLEIRRTLRTWSVALASRGAQSQTACTRNVKRQGYLPLSREHMHAPLSPLRSIFTNLTPPWLTRGQTVTPACVASADYKWQGQGSLRLMHKSKASMEQNSPPRRTRPQQRRTLRRRTFRRSTLRVVPRCRWSHRHRGQAARRYSVLRKQPP